MRQFSDDSPVDMQVRSVRFREDSDEMSDDNIDSIERTAQELVTEAVESALEELSSSEHLSSPQGQCPSLSHHHQNETRE